MTLIRFASMATALWLALTTASAAAALSSDARCLVTKEKDLGGVRIVAGEGHGANRHVPFAVGSFYIAKGAAIKLFSAEGFAGNARLLSAADLIHAVPAEGGVYLNAQDLLAEYGMDTVASFDCTSAGEEAHITMSVYGSKDHTLAFYNDLVFEPTGYRGNHATVKQVTLTNRDGKKLLSTHSMRYWGDGYDSSVDLDSGTVTITKILRIKPPVTQVVERQADGSNALEYTGAILLVRNFVESVAANREGATTDDFAPVPHMELLRVLAMLDAQVEGL